MKNPLVSIIIPIYNVTKYLDKCLESVINQSYRRLEIILVNDGSTDNCLQECQKWANMDQRIRLINKAHGGLPDTRNVGLKHAHGEYVLFVDSDDWLKPNMVATMLKAFQRTHADMVTCQFVNIHSDGQRTLSFPAIHNRIVNRHQYIELLIENREVTNHVWRKMFKRALMPQQPFKKGTRFEDIAAMPGLIRHCRRFALISQPLYFYRERANSLVHDQSFQSIMDYYRNRKAALKAYQMIDNHLNLYSVPIYHWYLASLLNLLNLSSRNQQVLKAQKDVLQHLRQLSNLQLPDIRSQIFNQLLRISSTLACHFIKWSYRSHLIKDRFFILKKKQKYKRRFITTNKKLLLLGRPDYGNLGDRAIAFGEDYFIKQYFPQFKIISILTKDLLFTRHIKHYVKSSDLVALQGGGNIGTLYPGIHYCQEKALGNFKRRKTIIFPQTFYYSKDLKGWQVVARTRSLYSRMKHLLILTREPISYHFVKQQLQLNNVALTPDIALILHPQIKHYYRRGALLILRNDQEKTLSKTRYHQVKMIVKARLGKINFADTHVGYDDFPDIFAKQRLEELWDKYYHAKVIVTDRLHGMIFAAITNTPCVVLPSLSPKIKGVYGQWLRGNNFIQLITDLNDLPTAIDQVTSVKNPQLKRDKINRAFDQMAQLIKQLIKE